MSHDPLEVLREVERRENALESMDGFRRYMRESGHFDFKFDPEPHHEIQCAALEKLIRKESYRLLISAPPSSAKSTYSYIQFPLFLLARDPTTRILCVSNSQIRAEEFNRRRRSAVDTPQFRQLSGAGLSANAKGAQRFETTKGGYVLAAGANTAISGVRADWIFSDDLVSGFEEASSQGQLQKLWDFYMTEVRQRGDDPFTPEVICGTRWSRFDPHGRAKEADEGWEDLCIPLVAEDDDPVGREPGEVLWPAKYGPRLKEIQRDPMSYASLFQQKPLTSEGEFFNPEQFEIVKTYPQGSRMVIGMDLALTVGGGDYSVIMVFAVDHESNITIVDVWKDRVSIDVTANKLHSLCRGYNVAQVLVDDDNASKVFVRYLYEQRIKTPVDVRPTRGRDKETRAAASRAMAQQGRIKMLQATWNAELLRELLEFPDSKHDDQIDCLSLLGRELYRTGGPPKRKVVEAPQTQMIDTQGQIYVNDTMNAMRARRRQPRRHRL